MKQIFATHKIEKSFKGDEKLCKKKSLRNKFEKNVI